MWLEQDTALALEWAAEQSVICKGCGEPADESTAPANEDAYEVHAVACHACRERHRRAGDFDSDQLPSMRIYVTRRDGGDL